MCVNAPDLIEIVRRERAEAAARERLHKLEVKRHQLLEARDERDHLVGYSCACGLWGLNLPIGDETAQAVATADILERHMEHVATESEVVVEWGYGVTCQPITIRRGDRISTGMICGGRTSGRKRCQFCKKNWSRAQCDFPFEGKCKKCKGSGVRDGYNCHDCAGTGRRMCNKHLCADCCAHKEPDEDYCPEHARAAGLLKREPCEWTSNPVITKRTCLHKGCEKMIAFGELVLFFPRKCRAMCRTCGEMYLEVAV